MKEPCRILIDHTHPEGDEYEWHFAIRELDKPKITAYNGESPFPQVSFDLEDDELGEAWDARWDDLAIYTFKTDPKKIRGIFNSLPYDDQAKIKEWCMGKDVAHRREANQYEWYDIETWTVIVYTARLFQCEAVWWLHE